MVRLPMPSAWRRSVRALHSVSMNHGVGQSVRFMSLGRAWTTLGHDCDASIRRRVLTKPGKLRLPDSCRGFCTAPEHREYWDITQDSKIVFKFTEQDLARFPAERARFRADPRLQKNNLAVASGPETLDGVQSLKAVLSVVRLNDFITEPMRELCIERLTENQALVDHFGIPVLEDIDAEKPLHNKAVPGDGVYLRVRMQAYWLALHIWLLHSKQFLVQEKEGLFGSAICAFITRRLFEWQWNQFRGWMHDHDVPVMSITSELQDLQEYVFGLCVALDTVFREEASEATANAIAVDEAALGEGKHGLAPRVKHVLWANVYSGKEPHDSEKLYELTVYLLQQRAYLESVPRGAFFSGQFNWAEFSWD